MRIVDRNNTDRCRRAAVCGTGWRYVDDTLRCRANHRSSTYHRSCTCRWTGTFR